MQIPAVGRTWRQRRSASIEPPSFFATAATRSSQNECSNAIPMLAFGAVRSLDESRKVPHGRKLRLRLNFAQAKPLGALTLITCCSKKHKPASSPSILMIYPKFLPTLQLSFSPRFSSVGFPHPIHYSHVLHSEQLRISGFPEIWICNVPWHSTPFSCHRNSTAHPD